MPKSAIQELNGLPPKPSTKTQHWNIAMLELKKYGENIEAMREKMGLSKSSDKLHKSFKSKESKLIMSRGETHQMSGSGGQHNNHLEQRGEHHLNGGSGTGPYSNHIPPSAAVVEVNPSGTDSDKSSHLHENVASSEPSSPGSPRDLQIDLDNSRSPGKKRMGGGSSTNVLNAIRRNIPGSLDFNEGSSPQAVGGNLSQLSRAVVKGRKAGDRLSAVLSNLTRRAGIIGGQGGSVTPISVTIGGSGPSALENMDTDEPDEANGQGQSDNPFSSIYHDRNKTAIALVDPDSHKRKRNINKRFTDQQPPAKKSKVQANASSKQSSKETSGTSGASSTEPALITTSTSEITINNAALSFVNLRPEVPTAVGSTSSVSPQSSTGSPKAKGQHHHPHHHHHQQQPSQLQNQLQSSVGTSGGGITPGAGGGGGATATPARQNNTTGKKKTKKSKQSGQSRSPTKGVSKAASNSTNNRAAVTTSSSSSTSHSVSAAAAAVTASLTQPSSHTAPATATTATSVATGGGAIVAAAGAAGQDSLSNLRIGVRGEEAAPGINDDDSNDFTEGSGLFADTVRKVNQSFRARVNHLTGNSEDMGYQYFTEKVNGQLEIEYICIG